VEKGADSNQVAGDVPATALEVAISAGQPRMIEWLLEQGAILPGAEQLDSLLHELERHGDRTTG